MFRHLSLSLLLLFCIKTQAQNYTDYLGAGHDGGITVSTSSDQQRTGWSKIASGNNTISGEGMEGKLIEASRLLSQATLGANKAEINYAAEIGIEAWIDEQITKTPSQFLSLQRDIYQELYDIFIEGGGDPEDISDRAGWDHFNYAWWQTNMTNEDLLRQRVALALSEILVISSNSDLGFYGEGLGSFYDVLSRNALGNYSDILREVTLQPAMGFYLSHLNNPRADEEVNVHPDENYAREVMQLFSIGLYELNDDGTRMLDAEGNFIPTYDNNDIKEFAKVFTGLGLGGIMENPWLDEPQFDLDLYLATMDVPMVMYQEWHEPGEKHLLNGFTVPAGQDGMHDIQDAINNLFNHHNVGPFIGRQLIQRLIKSNPSPEYIARITAVFNDNGSGERGDLAAVVKAILLDEEARSCDWMSNVHHGKLREPILKYTHFAKAIGWDNPSGKLWNIGYGFMEATSQHPMASPSVFNFFLPDFQPIGDIADAGLVAPEFQIYNTRTSIGFVNEVQVWTIWEYLFNTWTENDYSTYTDFTGFVESAKDPEVLLNRLDVLLTNGQLTDNTREIIKDALHAIEGGGLDLVTDRIELATYLIMISPDYAIFK